MSKFKEIVVNGDGNMMGDNNTQNNNSQNNKTTNHHHYNSSKKSSDGSEIIVILFAISLGVGALIWWFFNNIEQIYYYLNIATLSSPVLAILAVIVLLFSNSSTGTDILKCFCSLLIAVGLFGLTILARDYAPQEIIQYSHQVKFMEFWRGLTDQEEHLVISNFIAAILIALSALIAHLVSLRQIAYAIANPARVGFWYRMYNASSLFSFKIAGSVIVALSGIIWTAINGYIPI